MTLDIYDDVDPDAKKAAVSKVQDCFDVDFDDLLGGSLQPAQAAALALTFTVEQLEAMLAQRKAQGVA